jgi:hypothetical protein
VHQYGPDFYRFLASFAVRSADRIVPKLADALPIRRSSISAAVKVRG